MFVIWMTGLSGSGKSTIAARLFEKIKDRGLKVENLDGDVIRDYFPRTGFSKEERDAHIIRAGFMASLLEKHGVCVIGSFISPYQDARSTVRDLCRNYIEVYVDTSLAECENRDVKGLYAKVRKGEIKNFTGIDDPYEVPESPHIHIKTEELDLEGSVDKILNYLDERSYI